MLLVAKNGTDGNDCLKQEGPLNPCQTLKYVLENLSNVFQQHDETTTECNINVSSDNHYTVDSTGINVSFNPLQEKDWIARIIGVESQPIIEFVNDSQGIRFNGALTGSVQLSNLMLTGTSKAALSFMHIKHVNISNVTFINSTSGVLVQSVPTFVCESCTFRKVSSSAIEVLTDISKCIINDCTFEDNVAVNSQSLKFEGYESNISISNSRFHNNKLTNLVTIESIRHTNRSSSKSIFNFIANIISKNKFISAGLMIFGNEEVNMTINDNWLYENGLINSCIGSLINASLASTATGYYTSNDFTDNELPSLYIISKCGSDYTILNSNFNNNYASSYIAYFATDCNNYDTIRLFAEGLNFANNSFHLSKPTDKWDPAVFIVKGVPGQKENMTLQLTVSNSEFTGNDGTGLTLTNVGITVNDELNVTQNVGQFGGGLFFESVILRVSKQDNAVVRVENNSAQFGGGLFLVDNPCFNDWFIETDDCKLTLLFNGNEALIEGSNVYSELPHCDNCTSTKCDVQVDNRTGFAISAAANLSIVPVDNKETELSLFPGESIRLNVTLKDCSGVPVTCDAKVFVLCDKDDPCDRNVLSLAGPLFINLKNGIVDTETRLLVPDKTFALSSAESNHKLFFQCYAHRIYDITVTQKISFKISACPNGLFFSEENKTCKCGKQTANVQCFSKNGIVCIQRGHWIGKVDNILAVIRCSLHPYSQIKTKGHGCKQGTSSKDFITVGQHEDDQCMKNHGGVTCSHCQEGTVNTFGMYNCINKEHCKGWHKWVLLMISVIWPLIIGFVILQIIPEMKTGVGHFLCPLFFLAVVDFLPWDKNYPVLDTVVDFYVSTFMLGSELLGFIPWCFFEMTPMWNVFFNYSRPFIIFLVVFTTLLYQSRQSQNVLNNKATIKATALLLIISYWSLAKTSFFLIAPAIVKDSNEKLGTRLGIDVNQRYFHEWHILLFSLAVVVAICLLLFILMLFLSQCFRGKIAKVTTTYFLDEFQECYEEQYRWYSGMYFFSWILIAIFTAVNYKLCLFWTVIIIASINFLLHPYKIQIQQRTNSGLVLGRRRKEVLWVEENPTRRPVEKVQNLFNLNFINTLILIDLVFLSAILLSNLWHNDQSLGQSIIEKITIHILLILPLVYITFGTLCIVCKQLPTIYQRLKSWVIACQCRKGRGDAKASQNPGTAELSVSINTAEKQPLLQERHSETRH